MARVTKSGLELAFHQRSKQWCKYYTEAGNSKVKYFGKGNSVRDLKSYHAALRKYLDWCAERDVAAKAQQFADTIARVKQGELPVAVLGDHSDALSFIQDQKQKGRLGRDGHIITDYLDPDERDPDNDDDWLGNDDLPEDCFYGAPEVVRAARVREIEKDKDRRKDFAFRVEQLKQRQQEDAKPKKATIRDWSRTWLVGAQEQAAAGDIVGKTVVNTLKGSTVGTSAARTPSTSSSRTTAA
jgi:hypothetical protein